MAKRLNYTIGVEADTSKLQTQLKTAFDSLNSVGNRVSLAPSIQEASRAALELGQNLQKAINPTTGTLDLTKFNNELKQSGTSLEDYYVKLSKIGLEGQEAFMNVVQAITSAEMPLKRTNKLFDSLWVTMKNTMRWQLTSSALHGFVGTLEKAYGYAKDLNESLNNIRIVTNKSSDDMAVFAEQANRAAKALSTTTTDYTDASLIYYQQGLTDKEVLGRTETTIKMANVAGTTAETASQQLTAVWNNFYDGSKSLEYYADVMVKLGAATASSSDEISEGIEKFAAVANTVGLSYDYAATALATVTAQTRESASVVGTAFRTLFSRIQGLQQGETLDDGTTLNKYSKALAKVGVDIKDTDGELKQMDDILDELGAKWNTLAQDQKIALAETVAGVRQWTQLIALMDNWDFFQENLAIAQGSSGALEQQAAIYAKSWEAARDRTKAAAEDIYDSIINPDLFISLDNMATPLLTFLAKFIDGMGGLNGLLSVSALLMNKVYGDKIAQSMRDMAANMSFMKDSDKQRAVELKRQAVELAKIALYSKVERQRDVSSGDQLDYQRLEIQSQIIDLEGKAVEYADQLTGRNAEILKGQVERVKNDQKILELIAQQNKEAAKGVTQSENNLSKHLASNDKWQDEFKGQQQRDEKGHFTSQRGMKPEYQAASKEISSVLNNKDIKTTQQAMKAFQAQLKPVTTEFAKLEAVQTEYNANGKQVTKTITNMIKNFGLLDKELDGLDEDKAQEFITGWLETGGVSEELVGCNEKMEALKAAMLSLTDGSTAAENAIYDLIDSYVSLAASGASAEEIQQRIKEKIDAVSQSMEGGSLKTKDWADTIVAVGTHLSALSMGINALSSGIDTLSDPDLTGLEKFRSLMASLPMLLSAVLTVSKAIKENWVKDTVATTANAAAKGLLGKAATAAASKITSFGAAVQAALGPIMLVVSIAALVITAIVSIANAAKRAREEQLNNQKEAYENTKSEIEANEELIASYREALQTYQETGEGKAELNQRALEAAEALDIEGAAVANLTGNYEALNAAIAAKEREQTNKKLSNAVTAQSTYGELFENAMREGRGRKSGSNYVVDFTSSSRSNSAQDKALKNSDFYTQYGDSGDWGQFKTSLNPASMAKMYEAAQKAAEDMRTAQAESGEEASDTYNELISWLAKSQTAYEEYKGVIEETNQTAFNLATEDAGPIDNIDSYNEYLEYYKKLNAEIETRIQRGELEESVAESLRDSYLAGAEGIRKYVLQQQLLNSLSERFGEGFADNEAVMKSLGALNETELAIAISVVPKAGSVEEFANILEQKVTDALTTAAITSSQTMGTLVQDLNKNNSISDDDYKTLQGDDTFMQQMEEDFGTFENFQMQAQRVQIEYIRDYYTAVSQFAVENLGKQQEQADQEYAIALAKYNALETLERDHSDLFNQMADLRASYATAKSDEEREALEADWEKLQDEISNNGIDIVFDIDDSTETLDTLDDKLLEIQDRIDEINKQKIEIAMNWDDFDDIKGQMDSLGDFATTMQKDAQKVGNSYQYPIDAVRDWMEIYPDLFKEATVTNEGLIALDQDKVDSYIDGKQDEIKSNADAKIEQWELEKQDLEVTREKLQAEVTAYQTAEQGKIDISVLSNQQIADLAQQLTQYQIDCGVDEATAHANTLNAMGLNEEQYSEIVADVSQKNAENTTNSANEGAKNSISAFQKMSAAIKNVAHNVLELGKSIVSLGSDNPYTPQWSNINDYLGSTSTFTGSTSDKEFKAIEGEEVDPIEAFKTKKLEQLDLDLSAIDEAIATIDSKILAAKAIQNVKNAYDGTGGPDDDSGGSGKASIEKFEEALERYHEITREIEYQEKLLSKLDKQIDRTYGTKRLDLYAQKIEKLNRLAELEQQKSVAALAYVVADQSEIESLGLTPQIDQDSLEITNYTELLKQAQDEYKAYLDGYNAMTKEQQEAAAEEKQAAEDQYNDRLEALKSYEDSVDTYREEAEKFEEYLRQIEDTKLQAVIDKLELVIDAKDLKTSAQDFAKSIEEIFGDALTHGKIVAEISAEQAKLEADMLPHYKEQYNELQDLLANATEYTDTTAIQDQLNELQSKIISSGESILDFVNSIEDLVPDAVAAAAERFSAFTDQLEHNTTVLDTIKELYALQGVTYKTMDGFNRLQKTSQEKLEAQVVSAQLQRGWYEQAAQRLQEAQAKLDSLGGDEHDIRYDAYKKARDAYLEEFNEAQEAYLSSAQSAMETAQDMYLQQIERAVYEFGQAVSNGVGLDLLQDKYDHYIEQNERYFDKVNEAYQVSAWYNKLQKDIDDTTNSAHKERLKALQEEINQRREGNKLSQYDLDILNAKYQVLQAQMALEDAQNAKNKIQLVRDSQGNWNYQYTADQDQIANAQQNLLDAENDWYNIAKQQITDVTGEIVSTWQECQDKIKDIYSDMTLTDEERADRAAEIYQYYSEKVKYLEEEKQNAISDMTEAGNKNLIDNAIITGDTITDLTGVTAEEIKQVVENYTGNITDLLLANSEQLEEIFGDNAKFIDLFDNTYAKDLANMTQNATNFESELRKLLDQAQADFDSYKEKVQTVASDTGTTLEELGKKTDEVSDATEILAEKGLAAKDSLWEMVDATQALADEQLILAQNLMATVEQYKDLINTIAQYEGIGSGSGSSKKGYDPNTDYSGVIMDGIANGWLKYGSDAYNELVSQRENKIDDIGLKEDYYGTRGDAADERYKNSSSVGQYDDLEAWKKKMHDLGVPGYATGGYTGIFDDEKLAFLHQKELVLNQTDTENILAAVRTVRDFGSDFFSSIEKALDSNAIAAMALMGQKLNPIVTTPVQDSIEQTVHIDKVEFPNVTSRTEIEEAFVSLTNDAAQWARRKS